MSVEAVEEARKDMGDGGGRAGGVEQLRGSDSK